MNPTWCDGGFRIGKILRMRRQPAARFSFPDCSLSNSATRTRRKSMARAQFPVFASNLRSPHSLLQLCFGYKLTSPFARTSFLLLFSFFDFNKLIISYNTTRSNLVTGWNYLNVFHFKTNQLYFIISILLFFVLKHFTNVE